MCKIIMGMAGKKGSGKNYTAELFKDLFYRQGIEVEDASFAYTLKRICGDLFGIPDYALFGVDRDKASYNTDIHWEDIRKILPQYDGRYGVLNSREILQVVGTDIFREIDTEIWVKAAMRYASKSSADIVIFTDCRFSNECDAILDKEGYMIKLTRDVCGEDIHPSENGLNSYDWDKANCFSLDSGDSLEEYKVDATIFFMQKILPIVQERMQYDL